jgi:hypothetical protein
MNKLTLMATVSGAIALGAALMIAGGVMVMAASADPTPPSPAAAVLKSAGPLAFAPNGVLLIGDSLGGQLVSVETGDTTRAPAGKVEIADLSTKIAALAGTTRDQIAINDVAVNPVSGSAYISVTRGQGDAARPLIVKADRAGRLSEVNVAALRHASVALTDAPAPDARDQRGQSLRASAITDIGYVNGQVLVAGLSNEEFASSMRSVPYPLSGAARTSSIEMYHGSHGRFETAAPVRTFMTYDVAGQPNVLAAYTCTPIVRIPVSQFQPGAKIRATTIAELGNMNRPLDMIGYRKDGRDFILMANQQRGVMKLDGRNLERYTGIETRIPDRAGVPFESIALLQHVTQLDKVDDTSALILISDTAAGTDSLHTIALP